MQLEPCNGNTMLAVSMLFTTDSSASFFANNKQKPIRRQSQRWDRQVTV